MYACICVCTCGVARCLVGNATSRDPLHPGSNPGGRNLTSGRAEMPRLAVAFLTGLGYLFSDTLLSFSLFAIGGEFLLFFFSCLAFPVNDRLILDH